MTTTTSYRLDLYGPGGNKVSEIPASNAELLLDLLLTACEYHGITITFHHGQKLRAGTLDGYLSGHKLSHFRIMTVTTTDHGKEV